MNVLQLFGVLGELFVGLALLIVLAWVVGATVVLIWSELAIERRDSRRRNRDWPRR